MRKGLYLKKLVTILCLISFVSFICILSPSCKKIIVENPNMNEEEGTENEEEEIIPTLKTTVYMSAIEYPEDYDWKKDELYGNVNCKVVLFKDGKRILDVPAKTNSKITPEADMHVILEGNLYSFNTFNNATYIYINGEELYKYEGEERIIGIVENNNNIYTLGQGITGFSFRLNGEAILKKDRGYVIGDLESSNAKNRALYEDNGQICFSYYKYNNENNQSDKDYFVVINGEEKEIQNFRTYKKIYDLKIINGKINIIAESYKDSPGPIHYIDGNPRKLENLTIKDITNCSFFRSDDHALIQVNGYLNNSPISIFYKDNKKIKTITGNSIAYHYHDYKNSTDNFGFVNQNRNGTVKYFQNKPYKTINVEGEYILMSKRCAFLQQNDLYLALSNKQYSTITIPTITFYKNESISEIEFNGFPIQIEVVEEYIYPSPGSKEDKENEENNKDK